MHISEIIYKTDGKGKWQSYDASIELLDAYSPTYCDIQTFGSTKEEAHDELITKAIELRDALDEFIVKQKLRT